MNGDDMSENNGGSLKDSKEFRILQAMKQTLTEIIKDTATEPGMKHPLGEGTIDGIRQCLILITARETELMQETGETRRMRPRFTDEPETSVVVPITKIGRAKNKKDGEA